MIPIYNTIINAIDNQNENDKVIFFAIDAMGGSGKTTFAKKIYHYCHSKNKIILGSAATGLAAQVYEELEFETVHTQFGIPILETEEDYDTINDIVCNLNHKPQRIELINNTSVFIFDEVFSNHKYCITAILKSFENLKGKIVLFLMDRGQTAPVVKYSSREETVNSTIMTLPIWDEIQKFSLNNNLRLLRMGIDNPNDPHYIRQSTYATALTEIRTNGPFELNSPVDELMFFEKSGIKLLRFKGKSIIKILI
jgi:GTPase SAR1 family protein